MTDRSTVVVVGVDAGHGDRGACEHDALTLADRLGGVTFVSTHVIAEPEPHYAAVIETTTPLPALALDGVVGSIVAVHDDDPIDAPGALAAAVVAHRTRRNGRLIRFGGQDRLQGTVPLRDVTIGSAIEDIDCLGARPGPDAVLRTQEFVRPIFRDGRVTLIIQPYDGVDDYVPFEQPNPHPCCGSH